MYQSKVKPFYREEDSAGNKYREEYLAQVNQLIESRKKQLEKERHAYGKTIAADREKARNDFYSMLGWPLTEKRPKGPVSCREIPCFEDEKRLITRLQIEVLPGFSQYGILFRHKTAEKLPLMISQHGGAGTPEVCSTFFSCDNYNDMTLRLFERSVNVYAPQMLLWAVPRFGKEYDRGSIDFKLKQLGSSISAVEIYALMRALDYFEEQDFSDGRFGMAGLSYGGFYTLHMAAADTRIRAALSTGYFNDRDKYGWGDMTFTGAAERFFDAEIAALVCPRFLRIEVGKVDQLFTPETAEREYETLKGYYGEAPGKLEFEVFDGDHEFCPQDRGVDRVIEELLKS